MKWSGPCDDFLENFAPRNFLEPVDMKGYLFLIGCVIVVSLANSAHAQTSLSWKRWNLFNKSEPSEATEKSAELAEPSADEAVPRRQNMLSDWSIRPRPIEWRTPAFFKRMNENSTRMWRNTRRNFSDWAASTSATIRNSSYDTWEAITRGSTMKAKPKPTELEQATPNIGAVNEFLARPKLKF
jgi:hypothetical protein